MKADHARQVPVPTGHDATVPLVVDLDGTLFKSDLLAESVFLLLRHRPVMVFQLLGWLLRGRPYMKEQVARRVLPDLSTIPANADFLAFLRDQKTRGRPLWLATASHKRVAEAAARHFGMFDKVLASDGQKNLKGGDKLSAIEKEAAGQPFDYAGDSYADLPIWRRARRAILVNPKAGLRGLARQRANVVAVFDDRPSLPKILFHALRLHQWLKNLLIGVPLFTAHVWGDVRAWIALLGAFVAFGLSASGTYIINDLLDIASDRRHPRKRHRPIASGDLPIPSAIGLALLFFVGGMLISVAVSIKFFGILVLYLMTSLLYSFYFKTKIVIDVLVLASLYTFRIVAGSVAVHVELSPWLLTFSMFTFLSLALVKRCSELGWMKAEGREETLRRDYRVQDLPVLMAMGVAAGYLAVLVLALYVSSPLNSRLYDHPERLWLLCPPMAYWVSRLWIKTGRGEMHDDPLVYTLTDKVSWAVLVSFIFVVLISL